MPIINQVVKGGGTTPTGTINILQNGIVDVTDFASADVQVPTTAPAHYLEFVEINTQTGMSLSRQQAPITTLNLNGITTVGDYAFFGLYAKWFADSAAVTFMSGITTVKDHGCAYMFSPSGGGYNYSFDLSDLASIGQYGCESMFQANSNLNSIDMSSLQTITEQFSCRYMFYGCVSLTSIDLSALTTISGSSSCYSMFYYCRELTSIDLSALETINGASACYGMFQQCNNLTSIDLSALKTISGLGACQFMFQGSGVTTISLPSLTTINDTAGQSMFSGSVYLTTATMSSLTTVSNQNGCQYMFQNCTGLTSVSMPSLTTAETGAFYGAFQNCTSLVSAYIPRIISGSYASRPTRVFQSAFSGCTSFTTFDGRYIQSCGDYGVLDDMLDGTTALTTVNVNALEHIGNEGARAFVVISSGSSSTLTDIYFPMLTTFGTNPFYNNAFKGRNGLTIHFRKDAQATVEALQNYSILWGAGTGSTAVFDLAGTLTGADGNDYARSEINSVYASETAGAAKTATAWTYNSVTYYTSGGTEPSVGDTIYSDSACTTAVTTVSSIA